MSDLRLDLRLLTEERAALHTHFDRLARHAPRVTWLRRVSRVLGARRMDGRGIRFDLDRDEATFLADYLRARLPSVAEQHERRAMDYLLGSLRHNLAFRLGQAEWI